MVKTSSLIPPTNQFSSRKEWRKSCWEKILKSPKILNLLFTSNERHNIIIRTAILNLLNQGKSLRQISKELQISRQTISSIKKAIKENDYKSYWERGKTERKKKSYGINLNKKPYRRYRRTKYGKIYVSF